MQKITRQNNSIGNVHEAVEGHTFQATLRYKPQCDFWGNSNFIGLQSRTAEVFKGSQTATMRENTLTMTKKILSYNKGLTAVSAGGCLRYYVILCIFIKQSVLV